MIHVIERKTFWTALFVLATALGAVCAWRGGPIFPFGICGYLLVSLVPGAALYLLLSREPDTLECATMAAALSPVLTTAVAVVGLLAGISVPAVSV